MKKYFYTSIMFILYMAVISCRGNADNGSVILSNETCNTKPVLYEFGGQLLKKAEKYMPTLKSCVNYNLQPSPWEQSLWAFNKGGKSCSSVSGFGNVFLEANGNFFTYKNKKIYLHLDGESGIFERIIIGEGSNEKLEDGTSVKDEIVWSRDTGCFYFRTDNETEPVNPKDFGSQILLDINSGASSNIVKVSEHFSLSITGDQWSFWRNDNSEFWNSSYCPYQSVPWGFCDELRNGNIMYLPDFGASEELKIKNEAKLIRQQFLFYKITEDYFNLKYESLLNNQEIRIGGNWKYYTSFIPDYNAYINDAWEDYIKGIRPAMPDVESSSAAPSGCYPAIKQESLNDKSDTLIFGNVCNINGMFLFQ